REAQGDGRRVHPRLPRPPASPVQELRGVPHRSPAEVSGLAMTRCLRLLVVSCCVAGASSYILAADAAHWAFVAPPRPACPAVRDGQQVRTPIDHFVQATLEQHGLSLGPPADKATLLRRVSFGLTGLPPSPADVARFQEDASP